MPALAAGTADPVEKRKWQEGIDAMSIFFRYVLFSSLFFGCTPLQLPLHRDDLKLLGQNPTVYVVTFKPSPFKVDTSANVALAGAAFGAAGGAIGGIAGALVAGSAANAMDRANVTADIHNDPRALVRSSDYEDPVKQVRDEFVSRLRNELKMSNFVIVDGPLDDASPKSLGARFPDGIVLGFTTEQWVLELAPLSSDYWIRYRASGMFFLPREKRYLWRELCGFVPKDSTAPLRDLAENSGEGLKSSLADIGRRCAEQLFQEIPERIS